MIVKLKNDLYLYYNEETREAKEFSLSALKQERAAIVVDEDISKNDKKLLEWAKQNYPISFDYQRRLKTQNRLAELNGLINDIEKVQRG